MSAGAGDDHDETCRIDPLAPAQWGRDMSDDVKHAGRIGRSGDLDQLLDAQRIDVERSLKRRDGRVRIRWRDRSICQKKRAVVAPWMFTSWRSWWCSRPWERASGVSNLSQAGTSGGFPAGCGVTHRLF